MNPLPARARRSALLALVVVPWTVPALAQGPFEGPGPENSPKPLAADYQHMKLDLFIADMNVPRIEATQRLTFSPMTQPVSSLTLDSKGLRVAAVASEGRTVKFQVAGDSMIVSIDPPVAVGDAATLVTTYEILDPPQGLNWTLESPAWPGRPPQLHTQGETEDNSYWFPCHDFPNDKLTTEIVATVPVGFEVSSNGRLLGRSKRILATDAGAAGVEMRPYESFHYLQDKPHVPYLVSLVVGKFDVVDVGTKDLSMPVYAPVGRGADVPGTFGRTKDMVAYFGSVLDEPYPWDRYAQVVVWDFDFGGMENTSCTTLHENSVIAPASLFEYDYDDLIAHELAHQWFGDLTTCESWEHIWLNEGFATFFDHLWYEKRDGKDRYLAKVRATFDGIIAGDHPDAPNDVGMVSNRYHRSFDTFERDSNPYGKGASILHMLRVRLGDKAFFAGLAAFLDRHKFGVVNTDHLRDALETASGEDLSDFFRQWCYRPGVPSVRVTTAWDADESRLRITAEQTQNIDEHNPTFQFDLPLYVAHESREPSRLVLAIREPVSSATIDLPAPPLFIIPDPDLSLLAGVSLDQPESAWAAALGNAPTLPGKIAAARGLAKPGSQRVTADIRRMVSNPALPAALRVELVKALEGRRSMTDLRSLFTERVEPWDVRVAVTTAVAGIPRWDDYASDTAVRDAVEEGLAILAREDRSTNVRCAALRGLGAMKTARFGDVIAFAAGQDSQADDLRHAAIDAWVAMDSPDALAGVLALTSLGRDARTRAAAAVGVGSLGHHDPDAALACLTPLLSDRENRTRKAAAEGLAALADSRGIPALEKAIADTWSSDVKAELTTWLTKLRKAAE